MKRRLQLYLERSFGSAYGGSELPLAPSPSKEADGAKGTKGRAAKQKPKPQPVPEGGRFDLRYTVLYCRSYGYFFCRLCAHTYAYGDRWVVWFCNTLSEGVGTVSLVTLFLCCRGAR